jgi:hypothetical protein
VYEKRSTGQRIPAVSFEHNAEIGRAKQTCDTPKDDFSRQPDIFLLVRMGQIRVVLIYESVFFNRSMNNTIK